MAALYIEALSYFQFPLERGPKNNGCEIFEPRLLLIAIQKGVKNILFAIY